ncbi:MAG: UDP-N-acetylmuramoyl-L-alanyl-D-glutamate--2,6-diaminopimelate ligase [Candidatus Omnitrophica bacterium]|nr:UDP-N-acetylmuramoyl-L-alanyl-D-glutamate--2,6-diaminopimelate ligase [Candidatus Omnitrophota bacterium]
MKLNQLFCDLPVLEKKQWDPHRKIKKITSDSRLVEPGDLFVACRGSRMDGHDFLGQAIQAKASVLVGEEFPEIRIPKQVAWVRVRDSQAFLADLLRRFYHDPDLAVKLTGVTGTNGKTTVSYLLHRLLREKIPAAYLGTLWYDLPGEKIPAMNTTPGPEILLPLLDAMHREEVQHCIMEVSSHALEQRRVYGLRYELAIFTQLTQDHLDYHGDMEHYFAAKRLLFDNGPRPKKMLINRDCPYGERLLIDYPQAKSFGIFGPADFRAKNIETTFQGSGFVLCHGERETYFQTRLPMHHNVSNVVAVLGALEMLGYDPVLFRSILQEIPEIPGRLERVPGTGPFDVFVDYAHTPDAIENVLSGARHLSPRRILTLFGCGGDRDKGKRPLMVQTACRYSDVLILTSDNPRSEDPELILKDMCRGIDPTLNRRPEIHEILDRREAIDRLLSFAEPGDVCFILGKGHEDYQILGEAKIPFDDRLVAQECLKRKKRVFFS